MTADRERILNLPGAVALVIGVLTIVQLGAKLLPSDVVDEVFMRLSFVPARMTFAFAPDAVMRAFAEAGEQRFDGNDVAMVLAAGRAWHTPLTYALLHGSWTHLALNCATLAAFGSPVARRFGSNRFLAFFCVCAIAGALMHWFVHPFDLAPVVGASAAISGTMAAAARFVFTSGRRLAERRPAHLGEDDSDLEAAPSLARTFSNRSAMVFLAVWFGVNLLFGLLPQAAGVSNPIAWEAHVGGFMAGLLLFGPFDPSSARRSRTKAPAPCRRDQGVAEKPEDSI
ncbi:MAG: rhomboid family intramembrane serine protease [Methylocystis sp.]|nr:rhomboid family intramembrane serine protease [Methylocystis sp.]MBI3274781.1 rhomboid family intramembrane serine protease [Methylocystis sp.]